MESTRSLIDCSDCGSLARYGEYPWSSCRNRQLEAKILLLVDQKSAELTKASTISMAALFNSKEQYQSCLLPERPSASLFKLCLPSHFPMSLDRRKVLQVSDWKFGDRFGDGHRQFPHIFKCHQCAHPMWRRKPKYRLAITRIPTRKIQHYWCFERFLSG